MLLLNYLFVIKGGGGRGGASFFKSQYGSEVQNFTESSGHIWGQPKTDHDSKKACPRTLLKGTCKFVFNLFDELLP